MRVNTWSPCEILYYCMKFSITAFFQGLTRTQMHSFKNYRYYVLSVEKCRNNLLTGDGERTHNIRGPIALHRDNVACRCRLWNGDSSQWFVWHWDTLLCQRRKTESMQAGHPLQACWPLQLGSFYKLLHHGEYNPVITLLYTPAY